MPVRKCGRQCVAVTRRSPEGYFSGWSFSKYRSFSRKARPQRVCEEAETFERKKGYENSIYTFLLSLPIFAVSTDLQGATVKAYIRVVEHTEHNGNIPSWLSGLSSTTYGSFWMSRVCASASVKDTGRYKPYTADKGFPPSATPPPSTSRTKFCVWLCWHWGLYCGVSVGHNR